VYGQYFVNIFRISLLLVIAMDYGIPTMNVFHSRLGELLFLAYFGTVYFSVLRYAERRRREIEEIGAFPEEG
jgi:exosortase/archaeosortase family protein